MTKTRIRLACLLLLLTGGLAGCRAAEDTAPREAIQAPRQAAEYSVADFLDTTTYGGGSFSPDNGKVLVHSDASGVFNAYAIPAAGGEPVQLTDSTTDAIFVLGYFPADERFLYSSDQGGNELSHVFVRQLDGTATDLTPGDEVKASFAGWSQDDTSFFVATNERDSKYFDLYEHQALDYERQIIFRNDEGYLFADITADRNTLAFSKVETRADSDIYLLDRASGEMRHITPHEGEINHSAQSFSPDGTSLYYTTDAGSEFRYLVRYNLAGGEREVVVQVDWDVVFAYFSKGGKYRVVGINEDARTRLEVTDAGGNPVALPSLDADSSSVRVSRDESRMSFYASTSRNPSDLFVWDFAAAEPRQLTRSLNPKIDSEDLVPAEVVRFASFDGLEIPGVLYKPHRAGPDNKVPALVRVHGGPGGQSRVGYSALNQYLVNHGYAVYAINNRGSSGYGKTFFHLDDQKHGEGDLDDCVASKQMLIDTGWVDPERIGILGGSYGGYMVLAALAFRPDAFEVGVDIFGVANWVRTLNSIPPWWESIRKSLIDEMGADEEYLRSISPLFHAGNIQRPLLVLQGANDPRVLQVESDEMVEAARVNGVPVEYIVFPDEGHGFAKKANRERGYAAILRFLDRYLKREAPAAEAAAAS